MNKRQFEKIYYPKYQDVIRAIARKYAGGDADLAKDLEQEGALALYRLDPSKAKKNPDSMIRQAIKFRMIDALRVLEPGRYTSLTEMLERGDQLVRDTNDGVGGLRLISGLPKTPDLYDDSQGDGSEER